MSALPLQREPKDRPLQIAQPFALQAEQALIGALLADPQEAYIQVSGVLEPEHFYDPFCRAVFDKSMRVIEEGQTLDFVVLATRLEGVIELDQGALTERLQAIFAAFPGASNVATWRDIIIEKAIERRLAKAGQRMMDVAHAQEMTGDDKIAEVNRILADVGSSLTSDTIVPAQVMCTETMALIEAYSYAGGGLTGLSTGFSELDEATCGLQNNDLIILAARPSMGKTALSLAIARAVAAAPEVENRHPVLMFSLEMGVSSIGMRWLSSTCEVPFSHLRSGRVEPAEWERLRAGLDESARWPFFLERSSTIPVSKIAAKARRLHREHGLRLVIVDYLQLVEEEMSARRNANRAEAVGAISRALKNLAMELGIPVIALSQLNRSLEQRVDKRPMMSDLRDSGALEQDADMILFLYRDQVYNPNTAEPGVAEVIIGKQRNGPLATVKLGFDGATTNFRNALPQRRDSFFASGYRDVSEQQRPDDD
jgi:replicative DNA helicase